MEAKKMKFLQQPTRQLLKHLQRWNLWEFRTKMISMTNWIPWQLRFLINNKILRKLSNLKGHHSHHHRQHISLKKGQLSDRSWNCLPPRFPQKPQPPLQNHRWNLQQSQQLAQQQQPPPPPPAPAANRGSRAPPCQAPSRPWCRSTSRRVTWWARRPIPSPS